MLLAVLALLAAWATPLEAWGPQGHRTVGAIADRLLDPQARAQVARLLADDRDKFGNPSGRTSLEAVSVWADEIRDAPGAHPSWHYDDIPVCAAGSRQQYCPNGQCNSAQLERLIGVLADEHAPAAERNAALKWVVHLVGDIHQPLHAADNDDRGGNRVAVALAGVRTRGRENLHRAWDSELVRLALQAHNGQAPPRDIDTLAQQARDLASREGQGTPRSWAAESNSLARTVVYRYPGFTCGAPPPGIVVLDGDYQLRAEPIVRERLLLAGARLAGVLNRALAAQQ